MNNAKSIGKTSVLTLVLVAFGLVVYAFATPIQQQRQQQTTGGFSYAQLTIKGEEEVTWDAGGGDIPRTRSLTTIYRELGGNQRVTQVNLLNQIGEDGWELVQSSDNVWTFKRAN